MRRILLLAIMICGVAVVWAAPAAAHSELESSNPAADSTLDYEPIGIALVFNQNINSNFATVSLVGPDGEQWSRGDSRVEGPEVSIEVKDGLPNGQFTVGYRVTSADGHPITGSYTFTVDVPATPMSAPDAAAATPTPTPTSAASVTAEAKERAEPSDRDTMSLMSYAGIAVVAIVAIGVAVTIAVAKGKNKR